MVAAGLVGFFALATVVAVTQATSDDDPPSETSTTPGPSTSDPSSSSTAARRPVDEVPLPEPGAAAPEGTCPPEDGSGERWTSWSSPPPVCIATTADGSIDTSIDYRATLSTAHGDMVLLLNTEQSPVAVNDFVVLARSGYFDGAPIDTNIKDAWLEFGGAFEGAGEPGAGYTSPTETPEIGSLATPTAIGMVPTDESGMTSIGGRFLIATGENAPALPKMTTFFGLLLGDQELYSRMLRAATESGTPAEVITIESAKIEALPPD